VPAHPHERRGVGLDREDEAQSEANARFPDAAAVDLPDPEAGDFVETHLRLLFDTRVVYPVQFHLDVWNALDTDGTLSASQIFVIPRIPIEGRRVIAGAAVSF
jgi:hypothetical protein